MADPQSRVALCVCLCLLVSMCAFICFPVCVCVCVFILHLVSHVTDDGQVNKGVCVFLKWLRSRGTGWIGQVCLSSYQSRLSPRSYWADGRKRIAHWVAFDPFLAKHHQGWGWMLLTKPVLSSLCQKNTVFIVSKMNKLITLNISVSHHIFYFKVRQFFDILRQTGYEIWVWLMCLFISCDGIVLYLYLFLTYSYLFNFALAYGHCSHMHIHMFSQYAV